MTDDKKPTFARPIGWYRLTTKQRLLWAELYLQRILKADDENRLNA